MAVRARNPESEAPPDDNQKLDPSVGSVMCSRCMSQATRYIVHVAMCGELDAMCEDHYAEEKRR